MAKDDDNLWKEWISNHLTGSKPLESTKVESALPKKFSGSSRQSISHRAIDRREKSFLTPNLRKPDFHATDLFVNAVHQNLPESIWEHHQKARGHPPTSQHHSSFLTKRMRQKLRTGTIRIHATLDLHNHTLNQAHDALLTLIYTAQSSHMLKVLLIITGKGSYKNSGAIKKSIPTWLNAEALRGRILHTAHPPKHLGAEGAFYVILKKKS